MTSWNIFCEKRLTKEKSERSWLKLLIWLHVEVRVQHKLSSFSCCNLEIISNCWVLLWPWMGCLHQALVHDDQRVLGARYRFSRDLLEIGQEQLVPTPWEALHWALWCSFLLCACSRVLQTYHKGSEPTNYDFLNENVFLCILQTHFQIVWEKCQNVLFIFWFFSSSSTGEKGGKLKAKGDLCGNEEVWSILLRQIFWFYFCLNDCCGGWKFFLFKNVVVKACTTALCDLSRQLKILLPLPRCLNESDELVWGNGDRFGYMIVLWRIKYTFCESEEVKMSKK